MVRCVVVWPAPWQGKLGSGSLGWGWLSSGAAGLGLIWQGRVRRDEARTLAWEGSVSQAAGGARLGVARTRVRFGEGRHGWDG